MKTGNDEKKELRAGYRLLEYFMLALTMLLVAVLIIVSSDDKLSDNFEIKNEKDTVSSDVEAEIKTVNINTAGKEELISLDGIGEVKANRIIEYRKKHGDFKKKSEIKKVKGIGDATYKLIKDYITV